MELSSTLTISLREGFGKYLKVLREKNQKSWWINISAYLFGKMYEMKEDIHKYMRSGTVKDCVQAGAVKVYVKEYQGEYYVCLEKTNGENINRINLNGKEWLALYELMEKIMGDIDPKREMFEKSTMTRYYVKHGEIFYFHEASAVADNPNVKILKKKMPLPSKYEFMVMGLGYLIKRNIRSYLRENCEGCELGFLSQLDHEMCLGEWDEQVENYFFRVKTAMKEAEVVEFFSHAMKKMSLNESVSYEKVMSVDDKDVMNVVKPVNFVREYEMLFADC